MTTTPLASPAFPFWNPTDDGFRGFNMDPAGASGGGLLINGTAYLAKLPIRTPTLVSNLWFCVTVVGALATTGSFVWIVSGQTGAVLAQSADVGTGGQFTTLAWQAAPMTTPAIVGPFPYAVVLSNMATAPTLLRGLNTINNSPQNPVNVASLRWSAKAAFGSAVAPVTLSGVTTTGFSNIIGWS